MKKPKRLMRKPINTVIGALVRESRKEQKLTQTETASAIGLDQSAFSRVETGAQEMTAAQWVLFCAHVGRHDTLALRVRQELGL